MDNINSVKVLSIDEERLKFRVIVSFDCPAPLAPNDSGRYQFLLPPPTSFGNSHEYSACTIQCDGFNACINSGTADPAWTVQVPGAAAQLVKLAAIELKMNVGSGQSLTNQSLIAANSGVGVNRMSGYRQMINLTLKLVGTNIGVVVGAVAHAWEGVGLGEPMLCANPFGNLITLTLNDIMTDSPCYLVAAAAGGAGGPDLGQYSAQFTITMIQNN